MLTKLIMTAVLFVPFISSNTKADGCCACSKCSNGCATCCVDGCNACCTGGACCTACCK